MQKKQERPQSGRVGLKAAPIHAGRLCYSLNLLRGPVCYRLRGTDMPRTIWESGYKKMRHWRVLLSDDWLSITPWTEQGLPIGYITKSVIYSETKQTRLDVVYLGPFAIIFGRYLEGN